MIDLLSFLNDSTALPVYTVSFLLLLLCGIGFPLPEDIILLLLGYLIYHQVVTFWGSAVISLLGVMIGDGLIFFLGKRYGDALLQLPLLRTTFQPKKVEKVKKAFLKRGNFLLFLARFAPGIRSVTFWFAGAFRIRFQTFLLYDGTAALLSVPLFVWLGWRFGETFHELILKVKEWTIAGGIVVGGIFAVWLYLALRKKLHHESEDE